MENCEFCGTTYLGRTAKVNLKKHLIHCISNPKSIRYKCEICEKEFEKRHAFNGHKKSCGKILFLLMKLVKAGMEIMKDNQIKVAIAHI